MKKTKLLTFLFIFFFCFSTIVKAEELPTNDLNNNDENIEELTNSKTDVSEENVNEDENKKEIKEDNNEQAVEPTIEEQPVLRSTPVLRSSTPTNSATTDQPDPIVSSEPEITRIKPTIKYQTHIENIGWMNFVNAGELSGTSGRALRMESIRINLSGSNVSGSISYQVHVQNKGWINPVGNGGYAGTTGEALRLEAIKINLTGDLANYYDIYYQVHAENFGWLGWASNGEEAGTAGFGYRLEAIKIVIVDKGATAPGNIANHFYSKPIEVAYNTHVENVGWTQNSYNGVMSGTEGQGLRLEGIHINVNNSKYPGNILYQTHVQDIGWTGWVRNGQMSGTEGRALRLEGIRIKLDGELAEHYDIYYHTHVQYIGWTGWVKNGEMSGTEGKALRLEGIEIKLVEKATNNSSVESNFIWYYEGNTKVLTNPASGIKYTNAKKIIDVSEHNGRIDWNKVKNNSDIDGAILRLGYGSYSLDGEFLYNLSEVKRLGIPYGVYLFSYSENNDEALAESNFVKQTLQNNNANPTLGVYYDLENWRINALSNTDNISASTYEGMINTFIGNLSNYKTSVYTYTSFANNKLTNNSKMKITWIAQYYSKCEYIGNYDIWQYSSSGSIPGIKTRVDMNVKIK